jgi:hypothetical protein
VAWKGAGGGGRKKIPSLLFIYFLFQQKSFVIETHTVITFTDSPFPPFSCHPPPLPPFLKLWTLATFKVSQLRSQKYSFNYCLECPQQMAPHIMQIVALLCRLGLRAFVSVHEEIGCPPPPDFLPRGGHGQILTFKPMDLRICLVACDHIVDNSTSRFQSCKLHHSKLTGRKRGS